MNSSDPSRILLGLPHGNRLGGVTTWCINVANELSATGNRAGLLVHDGRQIPLYKPAESVDVYNLNGPPSDWAMSYHLAEVRQHLKEGLPLTYFPNGGHCGYAASAQLKRKVKDLRVIGMAHSDEAPYYDTLRYYEPIIDRFIGVSYAITEKLREMLPSSRSQHVVCLPYGVPIPKGTPRPANSILKVLFAGRVAEAQKRVSRIRSFMAAVKHLGLPINLHIAGDGPERLLLEKSLEGEATFHGTLDPSRLSRLMTECDIIIQFSDFEGTSLTMLEAMGYGLVPLMSAVSGIDAVIEHGVSGHLHPIGDVSEAASHFAMLHHDRGLLGRMSHEARETVIRSFSIQSNASQIVFLAKQLDSDPLEFRTLPRAALPISKEFQLFRAKASGKLGSELRKLGAICLRKYH